MAKEGSSEVTTQSSLSLGRLGIDRDRNYKYNVQFPGKFPNAELQEES